MNKSELEAKIESLQSSMQSVQDSLDLDSLKKEQQDLQQESVAAGFWDNQQAAQRKMQRLGWVEEKIGISESLSEQLEVLNSDLSDLDSDSELLSLVELELEQLEKQVAKLELLTFLNGKYDKSNALVSIHAGQGGTEANDWTEMLLRMYTRYFDSVGWKYELVSEVRGTETGYSTVTLEVSGDYAYGYLKGEHGTHRLVRNSPFNSAGLRQTSFAGVEVVPVVEDDIEVDIRPEDIEFSAVRSSGAGGQNVNKVATAVRIVHKPSRIAVSSSASRSQAKNRELAMKMLRSKLVQIEEQKQAEEEAKLKGEHRVFGWGNQIRNYVLQPYKLVKDLRTNVETGNTDAVLDGDLQEFIDAEVQLP